MPTASQPNLPSTPPPTFRRLRKLTSGGGVRLTHRRTTHQAQTTTTTTTSSPPPVRKSYTDESPSPLSHTLLCCSDNDSLTHVSTETWGITAAAAAAPKFDLSSFEQPRARNNTNESPRPQKFQEDITVVRSIATSNSFRPHTSSPHRATTLTTLHEELQDKSRDIASLQAIVGQLQEALHQGHATKYYRRSCSSQVSATTTLATSSPSSVAESPPALVVPKVKVLNDQDKKKNKKTDNNSTTANTTTTQSVVATLQQTLRETQAELKDKYVEVDRLSTKLAATHQVLGELRSTIEKRALEYATQIATHQRVLQSAKDKLERTEEELLTETEKQYLEQEEQFKLRSKVLSQKQELARWKVRTEQLRLYWMATCFVLFLTTVALVTLLGGNGIKVFGRRS